MVSFWNEFPLRVSHSHNGHGQFEQPYSSPHWENYIPIFFHIEWDMIMVTVFFSILNQMEIHLVQNRMANCHHDHIPFNVKGMGSIVFSVYNPPRFGPRNRLNCHLRAIHTGTTTAFKLLGYIPSCFPLAVHHEGPIQCPLKPIEQSQQGRVLNWAPQLSHDSLAKSQCDFFKSGVGTTVMTRTFWPNSACVLDVSVWLWSIHMQNSLENEFCQLLSLGLEAMSSTN